LAKEVIMPALGMAQETGTLLRWLKTEGQTVLAGEPLMEIETDKATVEIEAPASGRLATVTAKPGDEVPVGQVIALILAPGERPADERSADEAITAAALSSASTATGQTLPNGPQADQPDNILASPIAAKIAAEHGLDLRLIKATGSRIQKEDVLAHLAAQKEAVDLALGRVLASPKARRLARDHAVDLTTIKGSGPDRAVLAADVLAVVAQSVVVAQPQSSAPSAPIAPPAEAEAMPLGRIWQVMADRLSQSWQTAPHFYLVREANAARLAAWRDRAQARLAEKISYTDLLVKLVALALRGHPQLNAKWVDGAVFANADINIGLAVAVETGLVVPVIHQADQLGLGDLAAHRQDLVSRARENRLSLDDMSRGTFTISNLGMYGVDAFNAIVNPPQAAILALGRIADRVVALNGQPAVQPMITLTLSCDHRVVDGARAAQFLQRLTGLIEDPLQVLD